MVIVCDPASKTAKRENQENAQKETLQKFKVLVNLACEEDKTMTGDTKCCPCPPAPPNSPQDNKKHPPEIMICYRVKKCPKQQHQQQQSSSKPPEETTKIAPSKSRELRAGKMYVGCDCEKRNGLQDDCRRSECQGSPPCLTKPKPTCGPSEFSNAKHLMQKSEAWIKCKKEAALKGDKKKESSSSSPSGGRNEPKGGTSADTEEYEYECVPAYIDTSGSLCPC